jgi:hypothetical protein
MRVGDNAAATIDASSLVGDDGHPAGEFVAEVAIHAPYLPQARRGATALAHGCGGDGVRKCVARAYGLRAWRSRTRPPTGSQDAIPGACDRAADGWRTASID